MSRTIKISDELYARLEAEARLQGFDSVEQLLEQWQTADSEVARRKGVIRQIDDLRDRLLTKYGQMPDSEFLSTAAPARALLGLFLRRLTRRFGRNYT